MDDRFWHPTEDELGHRDDVRDRVYVFNEEGTKRWTWERRSIRGEQVRRGARHRTKQDATQAAGFEVQQRGGHVVPGKPPPPA
jgi:hypothetical protein